MTKIDRMLSVLVLGLPAPVILLLILWWGSLPFFADALLFPLLPLGGIAVGLILDVTLLRKFIFKLFQLPISALIVLEIFYTIMVYGFFMGFPVFNAFVGIVVVYVATKGGVIRNEPVSQARQKARFMNRFSLGLLLFVCICSAFLALNEPTIGSQLKGMLGLPFEVTMWMVWTLVFVGGALLLLFEYLVSRIIAARIFKKAYPPIAE